MIFLASFKIKIFFLSANNYLHVHANILKIYLQHREAHFITRPVIQREEGRKRNFQILYDPN